MKNSFARGAAWWCLILACIPVNHAEEGTIDVDTCSAVDFVPIRDAPWWSAPTETLVVGINNTQERADYARTISSTILDMGAKVINVSDIPDLKLEETLHSIWGLHIKDHSVMQKFLSTQVVSTIWYARAIFGDKDGLSILERQTYYELGKDVAGFSPPSFLLPQDIVPLRARIKENLGEIYVKKRLNTHSGSGIKLMSSNDLLDFVNSAPRCDDESNESNDKECFSRSRPVVVQVYIEDPLLVHNYKFDVRWWCVITSLRPFRAYVLPEGYAKIATSMRYDTHDLLNKCAHITNTAVQKQCHARYRVSENFIMGINPSVRSQDFQDAIHPVKAETLFEGAKDLLKRSLKASIWRLDARRQLDKIKCKMFQLLAIDVIYDRKTIKPWLLEINTNGYLQAGILKVTDGRERLKELFRLTGMTGFDAQEVADLRSKGLSEDAMTAILEERYRGGWEPLPVF